jgi:hypothetical protein
MYRVGSLSLTHIYRHYISPAATAADVATACKTLPISATQTLAGRRHQGQELVGDYAVEAAGRSRGIWWYAQQQ